MTNTHHTVLYTGVTANLVRRVHEHKEKRVKGFTSRYNVNKLVYFEVCEHIEAAILREKQIKAGLRARKLELVNRMNPHWNELVIDD